MVWIFSRTKSLTKEQLEKAYSVIKANKLSVDPIESVDQKNCPKDDTVDKLSRNLMQRFSTGGSPIKLRHGNTTVILS